MDIVIILLNFIVFGFMFYFLIIGLEFLVYGLLSLFSNEFAKKIWLRSLPTFYGRNFNEAKMMLTKGFTIDLLNIGINYLFYFIVVNIFYLSVSFLLPGIFFPAIVHLLR